MQTIECRGGPAAGLTRTIIIEAAPREIFFPKDGPRGKVAVHRYVLQRPDEARPFYEWTGEPRRFAMVTLG